MRFNEYDVRNFSKKEPPSKEGCIFYKPPKESYKERWFKLIANFLFYFKTNDFGALSSSDALGVLLMDRCHIQVEPPSDRYFVFSITFEGEGPRKHYFNVQSLQLCEDWVSQLQLASYESLRNKLHSLRSTIQLKTGTQQAMTVSQISSALFNSQPDVLQDAAVRFCSRRLSHSSPAIAASGDDKLPPNPASPLIKMLDPPPSRGTNELLLSAELFLSQDTPPATVKWETFD